ncbi:MAG: hypothetical protein ACOC83_05710 [Gemmatimonadota bacterium]
MRTANRHALLAVAALVASGACGEDTQPRERLAAAVEATAAEGSAAFTMDVDVDMGGDGPGMQTTISGEGVADLRDDLGRMEMNYPGLGGAMITVFDGDAVFVRVPPALTDGEARWVRRSPDGGGGMVPGSRLGQNPLGLLDVLDAVEGEVRSVGTDTVAGADVEGFGFTLAGRDLWDRAGGGDSVPAALRDLEIPAEAWLDDGDRVRRIVLEIDLATLADVAQAASGDSVPAGLGGLLGAIEGTLTLTAVLRDFGTPVEVDTPDEAQIISQEELQGLSRPRGAPSDTAG